MALGDTASLSEYGLITLIAVRSEVSQAILRKYCNIRFVACPLWWESKNAFIGELICLPKFDFCCSFLFKLKIKA